MKKHKKKLLLISVILSLIIVILLLTFYNSGDNFKPDQIIAFINPNIWFILTE